jgi:hypothetical protein
MLRALLLRGAVLWLLARGLLATMIATAQLLGAPSPPFLGPLATVWVVVVATNLAYVDILRRRERTWFGNLGVSLRIPVTFLVVPSLGMELVIVVAMAML